MSEVEMREPVEAGDVVWHSSEEEGGPDVGIHLGLGGGKSIWFGEISWNEWDNFSAETKAALGGDGGWWIVLHDGEETRVVGKCGCQYEAQEAVERLSAILRPAPSLAAPSPKRDR